MCEPKKKKIIRIVGGGVFLIRCFGSVEDDITRLGAVILEKSDFYLSSSRALGIRKKSSFLLLFHFLIAFGNKKKCRGLTSPFYFGQSPRNAREGI